MLRRAAQIALSALCLLFFALLVVRETGSGWADVFDLGSGKFDLLPLAACLVLLGASFGRKGLRLALQAVLIGAVFLFLGKSIYRDWGQITGRDWMFSLPWMAASFILMFGLYCCHASGWMLLLRRFRHPVPWFPGFNVWSKSLLARYVPGNVLMVVGRVVLIEPFGVPKRISLTSVLYEQSLLGAASATVVSVALALWPDLRDMSSAIWLILVVPPLAIIGLHPRILGGIGNFILRKAGREPIAEFLPFRAVLGFLLYYCATWVVAGLGLFCLVHSVSSISITDLPIVVASAPLAWLLALLVFISPSGLGVRESVYTYTLAFAFAHEAGVASAFAILARFWQTLIEISFFVVFMALLKKFYRRPEAMPAGAATATAPAPVGRLAGEDGGIIEPMESIEPRAGKTLS